MRSLFRFLLSAILAAFLAHCPAEAHSFRLPGPISIDQIISGDSSSCVIPFTRAGNLILIRARVDTTTGNFVLDTGAPRLVMNIIYFRRYATACDIHLGGITGTADMACRTTVDSLGFGPVRYSRVEAELVDLSPIEDKKGVKILGLLGLELFQRFEMIIDYSTQLIYLHQIPRRNPIPYHNPQLAYTTAYHTIPVRIEDGKLIVPGYIHGRKLKFIVDSGAETSVLDSRLPDIVLKAVTITRRVTLTGVGPGKTDSFYGSVEGLRIGNWDVDSLPVLITNLQSMRDAYEDSGLNGMLGFDFPSLHKIGFNFVDRKMYIWK
jgi:predicted aspartyl protease